MPAELASQKPVLHMIGNAHLDLAWLWRWQEAREEMINTSRTVLELMKAYPDFVYTCSQAAAYKWVEDSDPALFAQIREKIKDGRWKIVGGWWVQPDMNIPCGESLIRQSLYGKLYFREKFGVDVRTGYNVDSFGHASQLPQILKHTGIENYVFFRPKSKEKVLPATLFWWRAPDGSRVLTARPRFHYNSSSKEIDSRISIMSKRINPDVAEEMLFYGVGDHGGGPTRKNLDSIRSMQNKQDAIKIIFGDPESFFDSIRPKADSLKSVEDELQHHSTGCYTVHSDIKRWNRTLELQLLFAEKVAAVAELKAGIPYPADALREAWHTLLFHQFHDILAGTSIPEVYEDAEKALTPILLDLAQIIQNSMAALDAKRAESAENYFSVFNPVAWQRKDVAMLQLLLPGAVSFVRIEDFCGKEIPFQIQQMVHSESGTRIDLTIEDEFPSLGQKNYKIIPVENEWSPAEEKPITEFETNFYKVTFDENSGNIHQIYDKENDVNILSDLGNRLIMIHDPWDTWGHDVIEYRDEIGSFQATGPVILEENGPVYAKIRVDTAFGNSFARQTIFLYKRLRRIDFELEINWQEQFKMLKLAFPIRLTENELEGTFEVPFGTMKRPLLGTEEPLQRWMDVSGVYQKENEEERLYGVSLLNDSKYGGDILNSEMRLTILRSPIFAKHSHGIPDDYSGLDFIDQGEQTIRYSLVPHRGSWEDVHIVREAFAFNNLIRTTNGLNGDFEDDFSYLSISPENILLSAFKKAEDGSAWILRFYESEGQKTTVTVEMQILGISFDLPIRPYQIKSVRIEKRGSEYSVFECDGLERKISGKTAIVIKRLNGVLP